VKNKVSIQGSSTKSFDFHFICDVDSTQEDVFSLVGKPMVEKCLEGEFNSNDYLIGYNGCIFAYG